MPSPGTDGASPPACDSRPNLAVMGEIAVWGPTNGIHPGDPRPTGAGRLQTAWALCQHHLDRSLAPRRRRQHRSS